MKLLMMLLMVPVVMVWVKIVGMVKMKVARKSLRLEFGPALRHRLLQISTSMNPLDMLFTDRGVLSV